MVKNIADIYESSSSPNKPPEGSGFSLPTYTTLGFAAWYNDLLLTIDNELIYGHYGGRKSKTATFWFLRAGAEKKLSDLFALRCGITIPIVARTDTLGNIRNDLPWPKMGGAIGISADLRGFTLDFSIYGDPAESYVDQTIRIKTVGSLTVRF